MVRSRALLVVPLLALALAGCVPTPAPSPSASPTPTLDPGKPTSLPTPTSPSVPTPGPDTTPVATGCTDLVSLQAIYDYNPNMSMLPSFSPERGTLAGDAVAQQGLACRLMNQSSAETVDIGVVAYTPSAFAARKSSVSASPTSAFDGYFDVDGNTGVAQVFSEPYWITLSSVTFLSARDAAPLVAAVLNGLG